MRTSNLRLTSEAYGRAAALAQRRRQSLNRLFQDGLLLLDREEREKQLFEDFSTIAAAGADETDVEFALDAQAQIITLWGTLSAADVAKVERSLKSALALA